MKRWFAGAALGLVALSAMSPASARPARCETSDDGSYACDFQVTDKSGSFKIAARGKPTYILLIDGPGLGQGFADFGTGRNVSLPGPYRISPSDRGCWVSDATQAKICAR